MAGCPRLTPPGRLPQGGERSSWGPGATAKPSTSWMGRIELNGLRRAGRSAGLHGLRLLSISDNLSMVLAFDRGRSADSGVNVLCRRSCALQIGTRIQWFQRHIESQRNAMDYGSRAADRGDANLYMNSPELDAAELVSRPLGLTSELKGSWRRRLLCC